MKIALDVDGVLADFAGYVCKRAGVNPRQQTTWGFAKSFGQEVEDAVLRLMAEGSTWAGLRALPRAAWSVRLLQMSGVEFHFVSAVPAEFAETRRKWLKSRFHVDLEKHLLLPIQSTAVKPEVAKLMGFTHVVDDKPSIVNESAELGMEAILVSSPYMHEIPIHPAVRQVPLDKFAYEVWLNAPYR